MNRYQTPVQNSLESYVPLPLDGLAKAGAAIQGRYDANELADTTANTALSNIRAEDPDQAVVVKQMANQYKSDASNLLDKYQHRYDDAGFKREQQALIQKYSSDPRYAAVSATNSFYDNQAKAIAKENEAGNEWFHGDPGFKGVSENGSFNIPTQGIIRSTYAVDLAKRAGEYKDDGLVDGTTTNIPKLDSLWTRIQDVNSPEFAQARTQAYYHQIKNGIPKEQAMAAGLNEMKGIVYDRSHSNLDANIVAKRAEAKTNNQEALTNAPYAVIGNSYNGVKHRPDEWLAIGTSEINVLSMAKSSSDKTYEVNPGHVLGGTKWILGDGKGSTIKSTTNSFTFSDKGGTQLPDEVVGVITDGVNMSKLVAIDTKGDAPDGDYSTVAAETSRKDKYGNYTVGIGKGKPRANVQGQAVHVYVDAGTGHKIYVAMNKHESISYLGKDFTGENVHDYGDFIKDKSNAANFAAMLRKINMSVDDKKNPTDDFYNLWMKSTGVQRTMMNRMIDQRIDEIPNPEDGLSNIQRIRQERWGNQGKMTNVNN